MKGLQVTPVWRFSWSMHVQWRHNKSRFQWAIYGRPDRCAVRTLHSLGITQPGDVRMIVGTGVLGPAAAAPWLSQPQSHSDRRSLLRLTRFRAIAASGPVSAPHSLWARELGKYSSLSDHSYLPCLSPFLARRNNLLFIALLPNHYLLLFIQAKQLLSKVFLFFFLASGFSFSYAYSFSVLLHVSALTEIFTHSFHVWSSLWLRMWRDSLDSAVFVFRLLMTHRGQECAY